MWREFIGNLVKDCEFNQPASRDDITFVQNSLGIVLPADLKSLLEESNGVDGKYGVSLIWSTNRIEHDNSVFRDNLNFKEIYMPFNHLLFFADAGNGDQFAYATLSRIVHHSNIYRWDHEDDSRTWVAPSLNKYIEWCLGDKPKV